MTERTCCVCCTVPGATPQVCLDKNCRCHRYEHRIYTDPEGLVAETKKKLSDDKKKT